MSGIEGSPSNFRSCPFTWTLTIGSSSQRAQGRAHLSFARMVALRIEVSKEKKQITLGATR
jgi:hypothetical protein